MRIVALLVLAFCLVAGSSPVIAQDANPGASTDTSNQSAAQTTQQCQIPMPPAPSAANNMPMAGINSIGAGMAGGMSDPAQDALQKKLQNNFQIQMMRAMQAKLEQMYGAKLPKLPAGDYGKVCPLCYILVGANRSDILQCTCPVGDDNNSYKRIDLALDACKPGEKVSYCGMDLVCGDCISAKIEPSVENSTEIKSSAKKSEKASAVAVPDKKDPGKKDAEKKENKKPAAKPGLLEMLFGKKPAEEPAN